MRRATPGSLRPLYRRARCVFLDCDGVVFDSNAFKVDALMAVIGDEPKAAQDEMLRYWRKSGGLSRYVKLEHFYRDIVGADDIGADEVEAKVAEGVAAFGVVSRAGYENVSPVPEAMRLIEDAGPERCWVISGTDQRELRDVFRDQGIDDRFAGVLGSPTTKPEHIARVLAETGAAPEEALFVGDGAGDLRACVETGVPFVYLAQMSEWEGADEALAETDAVVARDWPELLAAVGLR